MNVTSKMRSDVNCIVKSVMCMTVRSYVKFCNFACMIMLLLSQSNILIELLTLELENSSACSLSSCLKCMHGR